MTTAELSEKTLRLSSRIWNWLYAMFLSPHMPPVLFFLDFAVYPPIILAALYFGMKNHPLVPSLSLAILGYGIWTLAEYLVHRFILHHVPLFAKMHTEHHDEALELIGTPTLMSLFFLYFAAYLPLSYIAGSHIAMCSMAGFLIGYISYVWVHFAVHHKGSGGFKFMRKLKRQHAVHHHGTSEYNFGVTTDVWDKIFGTKRDRLN
jgi:sterol desaturase/sphingolipid hydroxylase (fatty acid hydroxylase superfamily)